MDVAAGLSALLAGRYEVERVLGHGAMAVVYLARDLKHERLVAIKVLRPEHTPTSCRCTTPAPATA
jgi:serine/threonine-protein kinase